MSVSLRRFINQSQEMLKSTATKEVTGSWRSGHYQGNWSLKGSQTKKLP
jgi:hypothetical protein